MSHLQTVSSDLHWNTCLESSDAFWRVITFSCWRLLGLIPDGTPFSQLNKGVRDVMSATTKRDVEHQVCTKTCKRPQVPTKPKHIAKNAESQEGTKKRAPAVKSRKHLCQSGKMQPGEEGFGETRRKHLCRSQKCA